MVLRGARNLACGSVLFPVVLSVRDLGEHGCGEELFQDGAVGGCSNGVGIGRRVGEDDACAFEAGGLDRVDGEAGVVEGAEAVGGDDHHGQFEFSGEVAEVVVSEDRDAPAADAFDQDARVAMREQREGLADEGEVDRAVLDECGRVGRGGWTEPDGVDVVE